MEAINKRRGAEDKLALAGLGVSQCVTAENGEHQEPSYGYTSCTDPPEGQLIPSHAGNPLMLALWDKVPKDPERTGGGS